MHRHHHHHHHAHHHRQNKLDATCINWMTTMYMIQETLSQAELKAQSPLVLVCKGHVAQRFTIVNQESNVNTVTGPSSEVTDQW